jgi:tetratricopeptide (TPR) repeat protein
VEQETLFTSGTSAPAPAAARVEALLKLDQAPGAGRDPYGEALVAFLRKDYVNAAERAREAIATQPWHSGPPALASLSLSALGRQGFEAGDSMLAEARFGEAMEEAETWLERNPGDEDVHHAYLLAARGLASLQLDQHELSQSFLDHLQQAGEKALSLNPGNPDLQDDRLALGILKARRLADLDTDPRPELDSALEFMTTWAQAPLSPALRADRMLIHWLLAEQAFRKGDDPDPALAEALRDPGHTPSLGQDFLGDILNFKARVEASQGKDPRPTLELAMARMDPLLGPRAPRSLCETAAQSWLIRSHWEITHGLDPHPSLERYRELTGRGQCRHPRR